MAGIIVRKPVWLENGDQVTVIPRSKFMPQQAPKGAPAKDLREAMRREIDQTGRRPVPIVANEDEAVVPAGLVAQARKSIPQLTTIKDMGPPTIQGVQNMAAGSIPGATSISSPIPTQASTVNKYGKPAGYTQMTASQIPASVRPSVNTTPVAAPKPMSSPVPSPMSGIQGATVNKYGKPAGYTEMSSSQIPASVLPKVNTTPVAAPVDPEDAYWAAKAAPKTPYRPAGYVPNEGTPEPAPTPAPAPVSAPAPSPTAPGKAVQTPFQQALAAYTGSLGRTAAPTATTPEEKAQLAAATASISGVPGGLSSQAPQKAVQTPFTQALAAYEGSLGRTSAPVATTPQEQAMLDAATAKIKANPAGPSGGIAAQAAQKKTQTPFQQALAAYEGSLGRTAPPTPTTPEEQALLAASTAKITGVPGGLSGIQGAARTLQAPVASGVGVSSVARPQMPVVTPPAPSRPIPQAPASIPGQLVESPAAKAARLNAQEGFQMQTAADMIAAKQSLAQIGQGGAAGQAAIAQLQAQAESAMGSAAAEMQAGNAQRAESLLQTAANLALQAGDYAGANKALGQLGIAPVDFTKVQEKEKRGEMLDASNDLLELATSYASTNPDLAKILTTQAMAIRGQVYSNIAGIDWDPTALETAAAGAASGDYQAPVVQAMVGKVVPGIISWFETPEAASTVGRLAASPQAIATMRGMKDGTASTTDVEKLGYVMALLFDNAHGKPITSSDMALLKEWGVYVDTGTITGSTGVSGSTGISGSTGAEGVQGEPVTPIGATGSTRVQIASLPPSRTATIEPIHMGPVNFSVPSTAVESNTFNAVMEPFSVSSQIMSAPNPYAVAQMINILNDPNASNVDKAQAIVEGVGEGLAPGGGQLIEPISTVIGLFDSTKSNEQKWGEALGSLANQATGGVSGAITGILNLTHNKTAELQDSDTKALIDTELTTDFANWVTGAPDPITGEPADFEAGNITQNGMQQPFNADQDMTHWVDGFGVKNHWAINDDIESWASDNRGKVITIYGKPYMVAGTVDPDRRHAVAFLVLIGADGKVYKLNNAGGNSPENQRFGMDQFTPAVEAGAQTGVVTPMDTPTFNPTYVPGSGDMMGGRSFA